MPVDLLTSPRSPRVAAARRLAKRSFRSIDLRFLVEGPQAVAEALAEPGGLVELFAVTGGGAGQRVADLCAQADERGLPVHRVSNEVMGSLAQTVTPQGIVGVAPFRDVPLDEVVAAAPRLVAVLAAVRDPGNAGTVIRAADAAGADAVVFTDASVDPYNGKCVRASAGSLFHVPFAVGVPVQRAVEELRTAGLQVLAADGSAPVDIDDLERAGGLRAATGWLFGNEAWGLPPEVASLADTRVRVPIHGRAESLNLAVAAALCLYASARSQRAGAETRRQPVGDRT